MSTNYQIWLTYNAEKQKIQLPVNPESINVTQGSDNDTIDIVGLGDITIKGDRPPLELSFDSFFPKHKFPGMQVSSLTDPLKLVTKIRTWMAGEKPVHFICTGVNLNFYATIEKFTYYEDGGDVGTINYSLNLKEYRETSVKKITVKYTAPATSSATTEKASTTTTSTTTADKKWVAKGTCTISVVEGAHIRQTPNGTIMGTMGYTNRLEIDGTRSGDWVHVKDVSRYGVGFIHKDLLAYDHGENWTAFTDTYTTRVNNS